MDCHCGWNSSEQRLRNSIPKMKSLYSDASILPRRMSAAVNRCRSNWDNVSLATCLPRSWNCPPYSALDDLERNQQLPHVSGGIATQMITVVSMSVVLVARRVRAVVGQLPGPLGRRELLTLQRLDALISNALVSVGFER